MLFYNVVKTFLILVFVVQVNAFVTIPFNFSNVMHSQELPLKKMHALCMEIWGTVDAGIHDPETAKVFQENHIFLLSRTMTMQAMFEMLVVQLTKIMNDNPDHYNHILSELEHLYDVLHDTHKTYQGVVSQNNTYTYAVAHVLEVILQKLNFLLQTRIAISPYHAFLRQKFYPNAITPLSVPTYRLPVAPII